MFKYFVNFIIFFLVYRFRRSLKAAFYIVCMTWLRAISAKCRSVAIDLRTGLQPHGASH
jgi:hypothetical protein